MKNVKLLPDDRLQMMHDDGRKSIPIGHLSHSGNPKIEHGRLMQDQNC